MDSVLDSSVLYDFLNKNESVKDNILDILNRTITMFKYGKLPESLPEREIELIAQTHGYGIVTDWKDELVGLWGAWAPPYDVYYRARNVLVCNPWADINKTFEIGKDCVLFRNDPLNRGLLPVLNRYSSLMTEAEITFLRALINFRAMFVFTGDEDADKQTAEKFMENIEAGKAGSMVTGGYQNQIGAQPLLSTASNYITQAIEAQQYVLGMLYQKIGLQSTFNMKRERLTANESNLDEDPLRPLIDSMLEEREKFVDKLNKMYGTEVTVEFNSSWAKYNKSLLKDGDGILGKSESTETVEAVDTSTAEEPENMIETTAESQEIPDPTEDTEEEVKALEEIKEVLEDISTAIEESEVTEDEDKDSDANTDD